MINGESLVPEINNGDIDWVRSIMKFDALDEPRMDFLKRRSTVDVSACPGSGKTALLVAKLAILARKWPHETKGICALSHTNVARKQLEDRLGQTVVGQKLLSYPHFIGTIHNFANRYLALPWLRSNGCPNPTVNDDITSEYRRSVLGPGEYWRLENYLKHCRSSFGQLRICGRDLSFNLNGKEFKAGVTTPSFQNAKKAVEAAAEAGYFCYDEMFVWANALLDDQEHLPSWLAGRFPLIAIDEMQDTSGVQVSFLDRAFPQNSNGTVIQRIGDPNQRIFDQNGPISAPSNQFPDYDAGQVIEIPGSYRFGAGIAALASPFAVQPVDINGILGLGPKGQGTDVQECQNVVFVFPDNCTVGVLDAFGRHVLSNLGSELARSGLVTAVGHIHKHDPDVSTIHEHYPKSVGHYWDGYNEVFAQRDPHPPSFAMYIRVARGLVSDSSSLSPGVEKIAMGTIELARRMGDIGNLKKKANRHRAIVEMLGEEPELLETYRDCLCQFLTGDVSHVEDNWPCHQEKITSVASALSKEIKDRNKAEEFLAWAPIAGRRKKDAVSLSGHLGPNIYRVFDGCGCVDIRLGTIHSVKGQTHLATLLLSTYWKRHSAKQMLPWLLGEKANGEDAGTDDKKRLRNTFVAMTRPSHLLSLAIPKSAFGTGMKFEEKVTILKGKGWSVVEIVGESEPIYI